MVGKFNMLVNGFIETVPNHCPTCAVLQLGEKFSRYCQDKQNMTFKELQSFLKEEQGDAHAEDPNYVNTLFKDFARAPNRFRDSRQPSLTLGEVRGGFPRLAGGFPLMSCVCVSAVFQLPVLQEEFNLQGELFRPLHGHGQATLPLLDRLLPQHVCSHIAPPYVICSHAHILLTGCVGT